MKKSKRIKKSNSWKIKQHRDQFFKKSKTLGYRSRASFKLIELDQKFKFIKKNSNLLDLGSSPGGWTQVANKIITEGKILSIDIKDMESIRTIRPNLPLRTSDLRPSLMVKKGDSIVLSSGSGLLSITTTMIALENGKLDQQITLLNPESNEKIRALITGSGRARSLQSKK